MNKRLPSVLSFEDYLKEQITPEHEEQMANLKPNDIVTVYHGSPLFGIADLINGFDATQIKKREYSSNRHRGLFVTLDRETAKRFGGGAILELQVRAKNIHGTDWGGNIGRKQGFVTNFSKQKYPDSFRPYLSYTMLQKGEPQGLLIGLVKPQQIKRVWIKNHQSGDWQEYSREEYLKNEPAINSEYRGGQYHDVTVSDAGFDLSSPKIKLVDFLSHLSDNVFNGRKSPDQLMVTFKRLLSMGERGEEKLLDTLSSIEFGGSKLGPKAIDGLMKQMKGLNEQMEPSSQQQQQFPIRQKMHLKIPTDIRRISDIFREKGFDLYLVGGAVRDALMNKTPKDFDLATNATPDQILELFNNNSLYKTLDVGKAFGVIVVIPKTSGEEYEIATFREDVGKGRRPDSVNFTDISKDVLRRDLTINALFYDLHSKEVVDYVGGIADIQNGVVRAVGNPADRFDEDPLRILRAVRFATRMGSNLDPETKAAIQANNSLQGVSPERVRMEFIKAIESAKSNRQLFHMIGELDLWKEIFPGLNISNSSLESKSISIVLFDLLKKNSPDSIKKKLNKLKYSAKEVGQIWFFSLFQDISVDTAIDLWKINAKQIRLSNNELEEFARLIGKPSPKVVEAFIKYEPSVSSEELIQQGFKGRELGQKIRELETEIFDSLIKENMKLSKNTLKEDIEDQDFEDVESTAQLAHLGQKRRDGQEYIVHPQEVSQLAKQFYPNSKDVQIVALLHDTLEDAPSNQTVKDIDEMKSFIIGSIRDEEAAHEVVDAVEALTHEKGNDYVDYVLDLYHHVLPFRVKLLDMLHNLTHSPSPKQKVKYQGAIKAIVNTYLNGNMLGKPLGITKQHWQALLGSAGLTEGKTIMPEQGSKLSPVNDLINYIKDWAEINKEEIIDFMADEYVDNGKLPNGHQLLRHFLPYIGQDARQSETNNPSVMKYFESEVGSESFKKVWYPKLLMHIGELFQDLFDSSELEDIKHSVGRYDQDEDDPMMDTDPDRYFGVSKYD